MRRVAILLLLAAPLYAQTAPPKPKKPPVISAEIGELLFKAQAELQAAQIAAEHATEAVKEKQAAFQEQVKKAQDVCGNDYNLNLDKDGLPVCTAKPAPPPAK